MLDTRRPFTRADALAAGISAKALRGSRFRRIFTGVYVDARVSDHPLVRASAAVLVSDGSVASHTTAARVYELPVPSESMEHVTVSMAAQRASRSGVRCHVGTVVGVRSVQGVPVSAPLDVFVQLAGMLSLVDLVVVGDAMVRRALATPAELRARCASVTEAHIVLARRAADLVRDRVDSPMETRLRLLLVLAGLPEPEVNRKIRDAHGVVLMRLDLSYPAVKVAVEYDGRQHAEDKGQWNRDLDRREDLDDEEWRILVVTRKGIYVEPARTIERVFTLLRKRGLPGLPPRPRDDWRQHFAHR
ncbi:MAG TPA: hypothetical protein VLI04_05390 [Nocardioidaceae bacterium]|nr:hypothetical protein [Nocardioidaceae bacterium]